MSEIFISEISIDLQSQGRNSITIVGKVRRKFSGKVGPLLSFFFGNFYVVIIKPLIFRGGGCQPISPVKPPLIYIVYFIEDFKRIILSLSARCLLRDQFCNRKRISIEKSLREKCFFFLEPIRKQIYLSRGRDSNNFQMKPSFFALENPVLTNSWNQGISRTIFLILTIAITILTIYLKIHYNNNGPFLIIFITTFTIPTNELSICHKLKFSIFYLCNQMSQTLDISTYEFSQIK